MQEVIQSLICDTQVQQTEEKRRERRRQYKGSKRCRQLTKLPQDNMTPHHMTRKDYRREGTRREEMYEEANSSRLGGE